MREIKAEIITAAVRDLAIETNLNLSDDVKRRIHECCLKEDKESLAADILSMIEDNIDIAERDKIPLVADGEHILWVVGYRMSAVVKISDETREVLIVSAEETDK